MNFTENPREERYWELLEQHLAGSLNPQEAAEFARLSAEFYPAAENPPGTDPHLASQIGVTTDLAHWKELAGLVVAAQAVPNYQELPGSLAEKILATATLPDHRQTTRKGFASQPVHVASAGTLHGDPRPSRPDSANVTPAQQSLWSREMGAWLVAAASIFLAFVTLLNRASDRSRDIVVVPPPPNAAVQREEMLARAGQENAQIIRRDWTATMDPAALGASGDVVWDNAAQRGYMRFRGLPVNDPRQEQYQLWIFDTAQNEKYPIDGGVFDIERGTGDIIIPIQAKLAVQQPTLFAITVEKPGGVVVSDRSRLPLLAKVE
ncbi:MAG: anti-sigma factor [Pirellulales bacterium]|nr:anti-sigma factor [Pirellulales bacterium]